jgi:hypothetical protein
MTVVPLPDISCVRVRMDYKNADNFLGGSRFYLSYGGSAPTPGNCITLADGIAAAFTSDLAYAMSDSWALVEVDVLDIATDAGSSGQWTGNNPGLGGSGACQASVATNVEYQIARRYRGGKPRMFIPPPSNSALEDAAHWTDAIVGDITSNVTGFFAAVTALSVGAMGTLTHVNLSYYKSFTNITNSSGRERAVPKYRDVALHDNVEGYQAKKVIGSQRRRRVATTY